MYEMFHAFYSKGKFAVESVTLAERAPDPTSAYQPTQVKVFILGQEIWITYNSETGGLFYTQQEAYNWILTKIRNEIDYHTTVLDGLNETLREVISVLPPLSLEDN